MFRGRPVSFRLILGVSVLLLAGLVALPGKTARSSEGPAVEYKVLFSVETGDKGVHYWQEPGQLPWGPSSIAVSDDASIWIADTAASRLLHFSGTGEQLGAIDLSGQVVGIGDVDARGGRLAVVDIAAQPPQVVVLDEVTGVELASVKLSNAFDLASGLSGVSLGPKGEVFVELEGGARVGEVIDANGTPASEVINGYPVGDQVFSVLTSTSPGRSSATLFFGDLELPLEVEQSLGGVYFLGAEGSTFDVLMEEVGQNPDGSIVVDQTIRQYASSGELLAVGRVPLSERSLYVANGVDVAATGDVVALVPRSDRVDVVQILFGDAVSSILPSEVVFPQPDGPVPLACRSADQMASVYSSYQFNLKYLNNTNINGTCSGRTKPRYLGGPGNYGSVPYDWNGWDGANIFNNQMDQGKQAGDITSAGSATCSRGTDCSGYISRVWDLGSHIYTSSLDNYSGVINLSNMLRYDIFLNEGSHVAAYHSTGSNGYYISDSTTASSIDRVSYHFVSSSWINGYTPRRYNNRCPD